MESLNEIRLSLVFTLIILCLINECHCKPGWSFKKLSVWGRSSKSQSDSELDSSVKHAQLCEFICKKEPDEGRKYCDCDSNQSPNLPEDTEGSSSGQKQISLGDYFKQETNPSMKQQMCSLLCPEDSMEASKYCDCVAVKRPGKSQGFQSLADYFKSNNKNDDKSIGLDQKQLCEYICSDDPDEARQYCDCNKIREERNNLIASQSQLFQQFNQLDSNQQQRQGNTNNGKSNKANGNNQFSIKNLLSPGQGHSQEDICKVICAVEPDNDDGQCDCDDGKKESKFRWPWQRIRQWLG